MSQFCQGTDSIFCWRCWGTVVNRRAIGCTICTAVGICGVIITIALLALSINDVDENQMAIPYDKVSRSVGNVIEAGKHVLTPATKLFKYDRKFVGNDLDFDCYSKDSLLINLKISQQYRLRKDSLENLLFDFGGQNYVDDYIDTIVTDSVRDSCALFFGEEYFSRRNDVEAAMILNITNAIQNATDYIEPGFVQLRNIGLPTRFLRAIEDKQLALEDVGIAQNERQQALIQKETQRQQARVDADILLVSVNATAEGIIVTANQYSNARRAQWSERAHGFEINIEALDLDAETYVDEFLYPLLVASILTSEQQVCLANCRDENNCWYCFTQALPAVLA